MQQVVVDSSVILKWLNQNNELNIEQADKILQDAKNREIELFAPELTKYEVGNVLLCGKQLTAQEASITLVTINLLPITFVTESADLAQETFSIASKLGITYYDAAFLSLAKLHNALLITESTKHQGKTTEVRVIPLKDY